MQTSNLHKLGLALVGLWAANIAAAGATSVTPAPVPQVEWDTTINKFQIDNDKYIGQRFSAQCPEIPDNADTSGVFGTHIYPSNSSICIAALHAGAIAREGGVVTVQLNPGADEYVGSVRNGVETASLPRTPRSITFVGGEKSALNDKVHADYMPRIKWDTKFTRTGLANMRLVGQTFSFRCPAAPADLRPRRITGTDSYGFSSMICPAAVHAGAITKAGGVVNLRMDPGAKKLIGSIRHGVETSDGPGGSRTVSFPNSDG